MALPQLVNRVMRGCLSDEFCVKKSLGNTSSTSKVSVHSHSALMYTDHSQRNFIFSSHLLNRSVM